MRSSWPEDSLVTRLVVATVVAGLVTGVVGVLLVRSFETRELRSSAAARNLAAAERLAALMDSRVEALGDHLEVIAATTPVVSEAPEASTELAVAIRVSEDLDQLILYDASGGAIAGAASAELLDADDLPRRDDLGPTSPAVRLVTGRRLPVLELVAPVEDPPGTWTGVLVGEVPLDLLTEEAESRLRGTGTTAFVVGSAGTIVAHREQDRVLDEEAFLIREIFSDGRTATVERDGASVLLASARSSVFDAWVVVEQPEAGALAPVRGALTGTTAVFAAVITAIVAAVLLVGRRLLRPLGPLAEAVNRLERGELGTRVAGGGVGEVGVVARGFNQMASTLQQRQTELEAAERNARVSEQRLRLLVEGVADYAIFLLDLDGRIRSWNSGARRVFAAATEEATGRLLTSYFDPDEPPPDPVASADRDDRGEAEGWLRRADGRRFWAQVVVSRLQEEDGTPYGYAAVVHDLTERAAAKRALEAALRREQEAAEELRRTNELKDEFLAIAAHELQTPLAAILGASSMLDEPDIGDERRELRDIIESHAEDMRLIVDRFLDFARIQAGRIRLVPVEVRLDEELQHHVQLLSRQLDGHTVSIDAPATTVTIDRAAVRHIVTNLLSNAAKFSPPGSPVRVTARVSHGSLALIVEDEGIGIPEEEHDHIFELFRQARHDLSSSRGTGVGLAIVRRYVDFLGGSISIQSAPGEGSTFHVTLPTGMP